MNTSPAMPSFAQRVIRLLRHPAVRELFRRLLRVVIGLALIAGLLFWFFRWGTAGMLEDARLGRTRGDLRQLEAMTAIFQEIHHRLPTAEEGLSVFVRQPSTWPRNENWRRLMDEPLRDPWGRDYRYEALPVVQGYRLRSLGPDKNSPEDDIILTWPKQPAKERAPAP